MYTISIYFDEKTNQVIQQYINLIAKKTGNRYMVDNQVPPHITLSAFDTQNELAVIELVENMAKTWKSGKLQWVSVGAFMPYVMYLAPVLNRYLFEMSEEVFRNLNQISGVSIRKCYQPFQWLPHTTIGKMLSKDEMLTAFQIMHNSFGVLEGKAVRVAIAKTDPHMDIAVFDMK